MKLSKFTRFSVYGLLLASGTVVLTLQGRFPSALASPEALPDELHLPGIIRDFASTHPDFNKSGSTVSGQYVQNLSQTLGPGGVPTYLGTGSKVNTQWLDKNGNPIMPYGGSGSDPGLPGGHFDVDVYDAPSTQQKYHKHQFDDAYNVTFVDIATDTKLLFKTIIPSSYKNDLKLELVNKNNGGGGTYTFQTDGAPITGNTADGFTATFKPSKLTKLRFDFVALAYLAGTTPGDSHADVAKRDGALSCRLYDAVTNKMVYELAVYHHIKKGEPLPPPMPLPPPPPPPNDVCGKPITDTVGTYGAMGPGAVTSSSTFNDWFNDKLGTNLSQQHTVVLKRNSDNVYEYMTNNFWPIDNQLKGNEGSEHNNFFTYTISASFVYHACQQPPQFFEFQGSDDAWLFINGKMVLDIGGIVTPSKQYIALDRLGLTDGQIVNLDFFYAHRHAAPTNVFNMRTNLVLTSQWDDTLTAGFD